MLYTWSQLNMVDQIYVNKNKSYVYIVLYSIKYKIALSLKKVHTLNKKYFIAKKC